MAKVIYGNIAFYIEPFSIVAVDEHPQLLSTELDTILEVLASDNSLRVIAFVGEELRAIGIYSLNLFFQETSDIYHEIGTEVFPLYIVINDLVGFHFHRWFLYGANHSKSKHH